MNKTNYIPFGTSIDDKKIRRSIIIDFYMKFLNGEKERLVYNNSLKNYIIVNKNSMYETANWASYRYLSTLAVLQLESVLVLAKPIGEPVPTKANTKNQKNFEKMLIMEYELPAIGKVKLTVGILKNNKGNQQYSLTAISK